MGKFKALAALAAAVFLFSVSAASAATVATGTKSVDITCTGTCEFWDLGLTPDGFNAAGGSWLSGPASNSNANRKAFVESLLGFSVSLSDSSDAGAPAPMPMAGYSGGDNGGFTTSSEYIIAWGGFDPRYVLIKNSTAGNVFTWTATGSGSGLSGVDGFGSVPGVPLPASAFLMLGGLAGLTLLRRKRLA